MVGPDVVSLGEFFALETGTRGRVPLSDLAVDDTPLRTRVEAVHTRLSAGDPALHRRVSASTVHLALTARLVSPALAGAVLAGRVPDLSPGRTWWSASDTAAGPFAVPDLRGSEVTGLEDTVQALLDLVLEGSVATLVRGSLEIVGVSEQILWGNVSSALAGAATVTGSARPDLSERCRAIVSALVESPRLAGTGAYDRRHFRRTTCCLFYLAPGGGLCGDCVLTSVRAPGQA